MHRDEIPIAEPCPIARDWSNLAGDERERFCGQCSRQVYDLSAMTEDEARSLVTARHVCVRYTHDAIGRIVHRGSRAALALGAALVASTAHASGMPAHPPSDQPVSDEPGWLPWLAERAASWWAPDPVVVTPLTPPRAIQAPILPLRVTGGVPVQPSQDVLVEDRTGRPHAWLESSCCGRAPFHGNQGRISVGGDGYVEIVGEPESRIHVADGARVVCSAVDGDVVCR